MNECATCGIDFGSVKAFDRHRVGVHEYTYSEGAHMSPPREDGRRCLREDEIADLVDERGLSVFAKNPKGKWSIRRDLEAALALRRHVRGAFS